MTISNQAVLTPYAGNGSTKNFAITQSIKTDAEIVVILNSAGVDYPQTISTHYTLTGGNVLLGVPSTTVSMIIAPAVGQTLIIKRVNTVSQDTNFIGTGAFDSEANEGALDKLTRLVQEAGYAIRRALKFKETSTTLIDQDIPTPVPGAALLWNAAGTALEWLAVGDALGSNAAAILAERTATATLTHKTITTPLGIVKADVGLGSVDNISSANLLQVYRTILETSGSHTAAQVAGTYAIGHGSALAVSGTGTLYPIQLIYLNGLFGDYPAIGSLGPVLRTRFILAVNDVAPTGNYTLGLYPVTRPGTSGGAGVNIYTLGTVVTGSTVAFTTPAADSLNHQSSSDFTFPSSGTYCLGVVTTATVAASSHLHINAKLEVRYT